MQLQVFDVNMERVLVAGSTRSFEVVLLQTERLLSIVGIFIGLILSSFVLYLISDVLSGGRLLFFFFFWQLLQLD